jgi:hypothetical protein
LAFEAPRISVKIVEFCDTSDGRKRFRKYSAFKVGDAIIPRYLQVSTEWMIKTGTREADAGAVAEDRVSRHQSA